MFSTPKARKNTAALLAALGVTTGITAIGAATAGAASNVTLVFTSQYNGNNQLDNWITAAGKQFHATHPNVNVVIRNIVTTSESTYYAKLDLAERSSSTTPTSLMKTPSSSSRCRRWLYPSAPAADF